MRGNETKNKLRDLASAADLIVKSFDFRCQTWVLTTSREPDSAWISKLGSLSRYFINENSNDEVRNFLQSLWSLGSCCKMTVERSFVK